MTGTTSLGAVFCSQQATDTRFQGLDTAGIDFAPLTFQVATRPVDAAALEPASYVTGGAISTGPLHWDAGDDNLPGPQ